MPASAAIWSRNIRPRLRSASSSAISTLKRSPRSSTQGFPAEAQPAKGTNSRLRRAVGRRMGGSVGCCPDVR